MLEIESLAKSFDSGFSLHIERLVIERPGIYGLVGPNGCGKSSTAKLIAGILRPDSGTIRTGLEAGKITMVTQKPYIMDDTVLGNLAYPLRLRRFRKAQAEDLCLEELAKVGLLHRKNQHARALSGGEKQKLALLRAMIFDPELIILDEAMTDLDLDSLDLFIRMIRDRQERRPAIWIIISHQLAQVRRLCRHLFFMSGGRLVIEGPTDEVLGSGIPEVKRYLGENWG